MHMFSLILIHEFQWVIAILLTMKAVLSLLEVALSLKAIQSVGKSNKHCAWAIAKKPSLHKLVEHSICKCFHLLSSFSSSLLPV